MEMFSPEPSLWNGGLDSLGANDAGSVAEIADSGDRLIGASLGEQLSHRRNLFGAALDVQPASWYQMVGSHGSDCP